MTHYTTSKKCEATVYHWLYWDHLIARFCWILWEADLLIAVLSQALNAQNATSPFLRSPLNTHLRLRSCKCFSFRAAEWLWDNNWLNIWWRLGYITWLNLWGLLCWQWPCEAVKDSVHPSRRKSRVGKSSGEEEEGRGRGHLTDGLSEWIIDRGLLTDAASINSSKPLWWITADKQADKANVFVTKSGDDVTASSHSFTHQNIAVIEQCSEIDQIIHCLCACFNRASRYAT